MAKANDSTKEERNNLVVGDIIESLENGVWYKAKVTKVSPWLLALV